MSKIAGALGSLFNLNSATLSGAIDVIVVSDSSGSLHSSPFHVRFGKLKLLTSTERSVRLIVNGQAICDVEMRIGKAGECFFVLGDKESNEVSESVPLGSSPILSPEDPGSSPVLVGAASPKIEGEAGPGGGGGDDKKEKKSTWSWIWGSFPRSRKGKEKTAEEDNLSETSAMTDKDLKSTSGTNNNDPPSPKSELSYNALLGPPAIPAAIVEGHVLGGDEPVALEGLDDQSMNGEDQQRRPRTRSLVRAMSSNVLRDPIASSTLLQMSSTMEQDMTELSLDSITTATDSAHPTTILATTTAEATAAATETTTSTTTTTTTTTTETTTARTVNTTEPARKPSAGAIPSPELSSQQHVASPLHPPTTNSGLLPSVMHDAEAFSISTEIVTAIQEESGEKPLITSTGSAADISVIPVTSEPTTTTAATNSEASSRASSPPHLSPSEIGGGGPGSPESASSATGSLTSIPPITTASGAAAGPSSVSATASTQSVMAPGSNKSLFPTPEQLKRLNLIPGRNKIEFEVTSTLLGRQTVEASIWLLSPETKIVISDIDGTITKSDFFGQVLPAVGKDWSQPGVASLFTRIAANGYQLLYLTARAIGQAGQTRGYIESVNQTGLRLPPGPVIMSPDRLLQSFHREVIRRTPEEFKIRALSSILRLFPPEAHAFYAGFGNRITDFISYRAVSIAESRIFVINPKGDILQEHRNLTYKSSYNTLSDIAEHVFPPLNKDKKASQSSEQFNSFLYWSNPIPVVPIEEED